MRRYTLALLLAALPLSASAADKVFDLHVHLWEGEKSIQAYKAQLRADRQPMTGFGGIHMAVRGVLEETTRKNDELLALARKHPELVPIGSVHPYDGDAALQELRRLRAAGMKAIKLHPHTQEFDGADPRVLTLCKLAGELGVVVLMDNANVVPGDNEKLFNLAVRASKTDFVFTHMGALYFRYWNLLPLARTTKDFFFDNIHFDISAIVTLAADSPLEEEFVWTIRNVGVDRVLLGSDFPQFSLERNADALERLDLTEEEKEKIRYGNAARLFSL
jgi:predicted TIM-barrel fold metal-dependent hydrolase